LTRIQKGWIHPEKLGRTWIKQVVPRTRPGTDPSNNKMQIGIPETLAATGQETGWCWGAPGIHREWADWALVRALGGFLAVGEDWGLTRDVVEWGGFLGIWMKLCGCFSYTLHQKRSTNTPDLNLFVPGTQQVWPGIFFIPSQIKSKSHLFYVS